MQREEPQQPGCHKLKIAKPTWWEKTPMPLKQGRSQVSSSNVSESQTLWENCFISPSILSGGSGRQKWVSPPAFLDAFTA